MGIITDEIKKKIPEVVDHLFELKEVKVALATEELGPKGGSQLEIKVRISKWNQGRVAGAAGLALGAVFAGPVIAAIGGVASYVLTEGTSELVIKQAEALLKNQIETMAKEPPFNDMLIVKPIKHDYKRGTIFTKDITFTIPVEVLLAEMGGTIIDVVRDLAKNNLEENQHTMLTRCMNLEDIKIERNQS